MNKRRVALITGATSGIGLEFAKVFEKNKHNLLLTGRNIEALKKLALQWEQDYGIEVRCCSVDLSVSDAPEQLCGVIDAEMYEVDILVNNAATNPYFGPNLHADEGIWNKTMDVNLKGYFFMSQAAARIMVEQGGGSIINIASVAAFSPPPMQGIYAITKAGVVCMTKSFAKELATSNVRCNAICPGLTETKFSSVLINTPEIYEVAMQMIPMKRHAQPSEMVAAALYLASDASSYVTGACIVVDGGQTA